jgi:hypothetical protein
LKSFGIHANSQKKLNPLFTNVLSKHRLFLTDLSSPSDHEEKEQIVKRKTFKEGESVKEAEKKRGGKKIMKICWFEWGFRILNFKK